MAQPSVAAYYNTRKRAAGEDITRQRNKVLLINGNDSSHSEYQSKLQPEIVFMCANPKTVQDHEEKSKSIEVLKSKVVTKLTFDEMVSPKLKTTSKIQRSLKSTKVLNDTKQQSIKDIFSNMKSQNTVGSNLMDKERLQEEMLDNTNSIERYPTTPTKKLSTMEKLENGETGLSLSEIKLKLSRSSRLAELKNSISKINKGFTKLEKLEKECAKIDVPKCQSLQTFKTIELEVPSSPQKVVTPTKPYLSPSKHCVSSPKKNLFGLLSPVKQSLANVSPVKLAAFQRYAGLASPEKPSLTLPYKYRCFAEIFRCLDSVCSMYYNRKEVITFKKLKSAVEEMLRKNFTLNHLEQIKNIYPEAYMFAQEKIHNFGSRLKDEYELVVIPQLSAESDGGKMDSSLLLNRKRKLFNLLIEKVKDYHQEFLISLDPPMHIDRNKLTRWHPEFDIEKIPDIECSSLPQKPNVESFSTAKDVLSKAKTLFDCNTRMENALKRLAMEKEQNLQSDSATVGGADVPKHDNVNSVLKGIPKSLLEKVRARQAAKALESMTRSSDKDKEAAQYAQLVDLAKMTRNIFISEKKSVLRLELVVNKLNNSFLSNLTPSEMEESLRLLSNVVPGWIVFHEIRKTVFIKLSKETDMTKILNKLQKIAMDKAQATK